MAEKVASFLGQIVVTCDGCSEIIAMGGEMERGEAEDKARSLTMNPFGAPRCDKCRGLEPYGDINLAHTVHVAEYDPERNFGDKFAPKKK